MILENAIKNKIAAANGRDRLFLCNLLKEELQNFVLNFVYTSDYNTLIFTGGTCLRKNFGLNRLSEDLDFDYTDEFDIHKFASDVTYYFQRSLGYQPITAKVSSSRQTAFLKFPILKALKLSNALGTPEDLSLRCDFSKEVVGMYNTETNLITAGQYEFFCLSYDLPTLFTNKIVAILERVYFKGKYQKVPSKGRDLYDLFWLLQVSAKTGYALRPNKQRLHKLLGVDDVALIKTSLKQKIELVEESYLQQDLLPLLETEALLESIKQNFKATILQKIDFVL